MMNIRIKSILLAVTMVVATVPSQSQAAQTSAPTNAILSFVSQHKAAFVAMGVWFAIHVRLKTRPRDKHHAFKLEDLRGDFKELLHSLNIFDSKLYKQLVFMFDKYVIGLPLKLDDGTDRIKIREEDGKDDVRDFGYDGIKMRALKVKVLTQKPFGIYGLFEAYVLQQMKSFVEYVPVTAGFCAMLINPNLCFGNAMNKALDGSAK